MALNTKIEWTDVTWNPITGCTKVSTGCTNCYAERIARRFWGGFDVTCHPERLRDPIKWRKPRRIFVCSMGDLFHKDVHQEWRINVFNVMNICPEHTFFLLTKRPDAMHSFFNYTYGGGNRVPHNLWLGVSIESEEYVDRAYILEQIRGTGKRFISFEPLIGPITSIPFSRSNNSIRWVICGCESGPGARPMDLDWARAIRDACIEVGVPFFLKQAKIDGKLVKMPALDGKVWDQMPEVKP